MFLLVQGAGGCRVDKWAQLSRTLGARVLTGPGGRWVSGGQVDKQKYISSVFFFFF